MILDYNYKMRHCPALVSFDLHATCFTAMTSSSLRSNGSTTIARAIRPIRQRRCLLILFDLFDAFLESSNITIPDSREADLEKSLERLSVRDPLGNVSSRTRYGSTLRFVLSGLSGKIIVFLRETNRWKQFSTGARGNIKSSINGPSVSGIVIDDSPGR